ncbi:MAG: 4Fe-4S dicluster domain-containing protein [Candidatus Berkiella sp.]
MQHIFPKGKLLPQDLNALFIQLQNKGYQIIGPKREGQCITYAQIDSIEDLPKGWTDYQEKGTYRLKNRNDNAYFGYNIGSRTFKQFLFPPREKIFKISKQGNMQTLSLDKIHKLALIGVRACELHAIQIQDKVFMSDNHADQHYLQRRSQSFIVALNCHTAANTCFCVSMNTGPEVASGYDLNLSEIINDKEHYFICEVGSEKGREIFEKLTITEVTQDDMNKKKKMIEHTASKMGRSLDTTNIKEKLEKAHDHPHWDDVASRCINCANCALACPTCFCSTNEDVSDIEQETTTRTKVWDTCFSQEYSHIHDANVRSSSKSRYRQWLTHKLGTWHDQFDTSGCVGCGRCLTWCPVGIDLTEEFASLTQIDDSK